MGATVVANVQMWGRWNSHNNEPHADLNYELVGGMTFFDKHRRGDATDGGVD